MLINLTTTKTFVLTLHDTPNRLIAFNENIKNKLSVTPFYGERFPTVDQGCYISSLKLYKTITPPTLILEDDVNCTNNFKP